MSSAFDGDKDGRRIAKRKALAAAEAEKVAQLLNVLLRRSGLPGCDDLIKTLRDHESSQLQRAYGRLASRKTYKGISDHPLLEKCESNLLFLDESGNSAKETTPPPRFFSLGAISITEDAMDLYRKSADQIKAQFFGTTEITFHEPYMRNHEGPYYFSGNTNKQQEFDSALEKLLIDTPFVAFGAGIRKDAFETDFVNTGIDPYLPTDVYAVAITLLIERYVDYLALGRKDPYKKALGRITFESQGPLEDAIHQLVYARLLRDGSQWIKGSAFRGWLEAGCKFQPKRGSDPTELADIVSRELYEWIRSDCKMEPKFWSVLKAKVYCREDGLRGSFGFKVFPDSDIRETIEKHRSECGAKLGSH